MDHRVVFTEIRSAFCVGYLPITICTLYSASCVRRRKVKVQGHNSLSASQVVLNSAV